jgi:hypothetical protein
LGEEEREKRKGRRRKEERKEEKKKFEGEKGKWNKRGLSKWKLRMEKGLGNK